MRKRILLPGLILLFSFCSNWSLFSQLSIGGEPFFLRDAFQMARGGVELSTVELPVPDMAEINERNARHPDNPLLSVPVRVSLTLENAGQWIDLGNGDRLWLIQLHATGAEGLAVLSDDFFLPPGARL